MPKRAGAVLTPSAVMALRFIQNYRYLTVNQVAQVASLRPKSASELLLRLERQKLLSHFGNVGMRGYGKTPKVYYLTRGGHGALAAEMLAEGEEIAPYQPVNVSRRWSPLMFHRIATLDVIMALERGIAELPKYHLLTTLIEYRRQKVDGRWVAETTDFIAAPETADSRIIPDAGFVLENSETGARALFLIEVDLGTETQVSKVDEHVRQSFRYKIEQYDRYLRSGRFQARYRSWGVFQNFTALIITNSEQRLQNMRQKLADLPQQLHQYYRFSTLEEVCVNFFHANWRGRPCDDRKAYALIKQGEIHES